MAISGNAQRDGNDVATLLAVSSVDGSTPVVIWANPTTHRLLVDNANTGVAIGGTITGGTNNSILFVNPANVLAQDNTNFSYDFTSKQLLLGLTGSPWYHDSRVRLGIVGNVNDYSDVAAQNQNSGSAATTDFFTSADNDSSTLTGHYTDFGITSSGWSATNAGNVKTVSVASGGTGYTVGNVLTISTGGNGDAQVTVLTAPGGVISSVQVTNNGTGYTTGSARSTTGGSGTGATINILSLLNFSLWGANDGYLFNSGANLVLSTDTSGTAIKISVGGIGTTNEVVRFTTTGQTLGLIGTLTGALTFAGATSTSITLQGQAVGLSSVLTLPTGTDTLVGKATTDILTNKSISFGTNTITTTSAQLATAVSDETGSGSLVFGTNPTIAKPVINARNQTAQIYTPAGAATATLDLSLGDQHDITMPAGNITIALSNDTNNQIFSISITQDSGGSRTVTWFTTIKWAGGTPPTLTTTANKRDRFTFVRTGSNTYDGMVAGQNI